jgi:predicted PurR-regulated permease PerM
MNPLDPSSSGQLAEAHEDSRRWQWLAITIVVGLLIWLLAPVLTPFVIAAFFGYLGDPLVDRLELARLGRTFSVSLVFFAMTTLAALALIFLLPLLGDQISHFVEQMPAYAAWLRNTALPWINSRTHLDLAPYIDPQQVIAMLRAHWQDAGVASNVLGKVSHSGMVLIQIVSTIFLVPVLSFYFLRDWDVLVERVDMLLPRAIEPTVARLARESNEMLGGFLRGQLSVMVCLGIWYTVALWFVGLDLALLIGMITGMLSFVPYLGVITGISISLIAALVQFGDFQHVLMVAVAFAIGQTLESFVLVPRLVGDKIGMHPVGVIFALMAGGQLFGFLGVLLALPVSAIAMVLLRYGHERYTSSKLYVGHAPTQVEETVALAVVEQRVRVERSDDEPPADAS